MDVDDDKYHWQQACMRSIDVFMKSPESMKATIHSFCGTGKSKVEIDGLVEYTTGISILLVSSLNLYYQFKSEYFHDKPKFDVIGVNSGKKAYSVSNNNVIISKLTANPKPKIIVCLYQSFPQLTNCLRQHEDLFKQLNFLILDESHYLGESNCEKVIVDAMSEYKHLKQLNFSATPTAEQKKDTIFRYTYLDGVVDDILQAFDIRVTFKEIESELIEVPKDGNCFFHCLAHTLSLSTSSFNNILKSHTDIRKELIDFFITQEDIIQENACDIENIKKLYKDGEWNYKEFDLLPELASIYYNKPIKIYNRNLQQTFLFKPPGSERQDYENDECMCFQLYNDHYDIMQYKKKDASEDDLVDRYVHYMVKNFLQSGNNKIMAFHGGVKEENMKSILPVEIMMKHRNRVLDKLHALYPSYSFHLECLTGTMLDTRRQEILENFKAHDDPNSVFILSSCKTIQEGVDTYDANAVIWIDPRRDYKVIIQNLGRICRKSNKSRNGSVIIPIEIDRYIYSTCESESHMSNLIQNDLDSENGNFNPIVHLLSSLKEENPEIVAQLEALFHSSSSSSSSSTSRKKRELEKDSGGDDQSSSLSTKRPRLSVDDDMQIDIEDAEGNTFLERMRNMKKKNYKQRLFFDFECHKFINENDFTNIFCARMESKINYDKVTDEWFVNFEDAKDFKNEKGQWIQNSWFQNQIKFYRNERCTVFNNKKCKKEFKLFCEEKGIKLEKELTPEEEWFVKFEEAKDFKNEKGQWIRNSWFQNQIKFYRNEQYTVFHNKKCKEEFKLFCEEKGIKLEKELTPEEEWFVKFEEAKDFKNEKGQWIQNSWFQNQIKFYRNEQYTVFYNKKCEKEFKLFCEEKGIKLKKMTPRQKWKNHLYDVCNWMYTHKKRPTPKHNNVAKGWIDRQNKSYNKNKYIMKSDKIVCDIWKQIQNYMNNKEWELMKDYVLKLQKEDDDNDDNADQDAEENMNEDDADQDMNMNNNHVEYDENQEDEDNDNNKAFENDNREYRSNELKLVSTRKEYFTPKQKEYIKSKQDYKCMNSPGSEFERLYEYQCPCYRRGGDGSFDRKDLCDVDHIVACNKGGTSNIDNGMALCLNCHRVKTNYEKKNKKSM